MRTPPPFRLAFLLRLVVFAVWFSSANSFAQSLPPPIIDPHSAEICMNSRISYHGGWSAVYTDQMLGDILDATARAPRTGGPPLIYAATRENVYRYDFATHSRVVHKAGDFRSDATAAFEIGVCADNMFDAGAAMHFSQLESIAIWTGTNSQLASCPRASATTYANSNWSPAQPVDIAISFGRRNVPGFTSTLVAVSSDGTLPNPRTDSGMTMDDAILNLICGTEFAGDDLTADQVSQLLWGAYGCSNHYASGGRAGLVCSSAVASYYLTRHIYAVGSAAVHRFHNRRPPGTDLTSRDHRIEVVTSGDRRALLRGAVAALPEAPEYFVICVGSVTDWSSLEVGFAAVGAMLQASALELQSYPCANFSSAEQSAIRQATGIPSGDIPLEIVALGRAGSSSTESERAPEWPVALSFDRTIACEGDVVVRYQLPRATQIDLAVYNCQGRRVRQLVAGAQTAGPHEVLWDGRDEHRRSVLSGIHFCRLKIAGRSIGARLVVIR